MCGVFGAILFSRRSESEVKSLIARSLSEIKHRGPDGEGTWISLKSGIGLGHVRLAVVDLKTGDQPFVSPDKRYVIVYNGEIYNFQEISDLLNCGEVPKSEVELIYHAYKKWGKSFVKHLRGMFSLLIWDSFNEEMYVCRDRFGIKPLYWYKDETGLYFGSEIKALLPLIADRAIDLNGLSDYFQFQYCLNDKTLFKGVNQFPKSHYATVKRDGVLISHKYWEVNYEINFNNTEKWFEEQLIQLLNDSVKLHTRADVEIGSYLSGGIDSSLVAVLAKKHIHQSRYLSYNGRFADFETYDESYFASIQAKQFGLELNTVNITESDFINNIRKMIWHLDQPCAGPGAFPQYMLSKIVAKDLKVVLSGHGGDEIFGGYARYLIAYFEQCIKGAIDGTLRNGKYIVTYESIIDNLGTLQKYKPLLKEFFAVGMFEDLDSRYYRLISKSNSIKGLLADGVIHERRMFEEYRNIFCGDNTRKESYFDAMTHFDFKALLPSLLHVEDRVSMAHGLESRVPFLDHKLVEFCATIPADIKFKNGELKRLLKTVFKDSLAHDVRIRPDKMGFPVPLNNWLSNGGKVKEFVCDIMQSRKAKERSYLNEDYASSHFVGGQSEFNRDIWALLSLELWQQEFIDNY